MLNETFLLFSNTVWCLCYLFRFRNVLPLKSEVCWVLYPPCLWHLESQARISWEHFCPGIFCPIFVLSFHLSDVLPCLLCPKVHFGWLPKASKLRPPRLHFGWKTKPFWTVLLEETKIREILEKSNSIKTQCLQNWNVSWIFSDTVHIVRKSPKK